MSNLHYPQFCALARAAELIGERWTLLIIRELLLGPKRFGDLLDHLDGISPTLLTARLIALIDSKVVRRITLPRPVNAQLYELTDIGWEIQPAIRELIRWGGHFLFPPVPGDTFEPDWVLLGLDAIAKRAPVPEVSVGLVVTHGRKSAGFTIAGGQSGTTIRKGGAGSARSQAAETIRPGRTQAWNNFSAVNGKPDGMDQITAVTDRLIRQVGAVQRHRGPP